MIIETNAYFGDLEVEVIENKVHVTQEQDTIKFGISDIPYLYDALETIKGGIYVSMGLHINDDVSIRVYPDSDGINLETEHLCLSVDDGQKFIKAVLELLLKCNAELKWDIPGRDATLISNVGFDGDETGDYDTRLEVVDYNNQDQLVLTQTFDGTNYVTFNRTELEVLVKYLNTIIPTMKY